MNSQRRIHDGIVGILVTAGTALAYWVNPMWWALPGVVGLLLIQSAFTGFCPVYYTLEMLRIGKPTPQSA
jgi:hypothetical protein